MGKRRPNGDGLVRRRSDGRWEGRIVVGHKDDGKPIFRAVYAEKQGELMPKLNKLKMQYEGVEITEDSAITLGEWMEKWLTEYKSPVLRASTFSSYRSDINYHILPYLGTRKITQIKTSDLQRLYNKLLITGRRSLDKKEGGLSPATVRGIHNILHDALDCAVKEGILPTNPTSGTAPPKIRRKEKQVLTKEQLETFMELIREDEAWYDFFYTEMITGMRKGEICGLRWEDYDDEKGTLNVVRSIKFEQGKLVVGETKTEEGRRTIYLPESLWQILHERRKNKVSEWIFPNLLNLENPIYPSTAYGQLKKLLKKGNLPNIRFHDLRHTFTSHAANSGIAPKTLSEIVGHTKASFTLDTYAHVTGDMQKNAANIVTNYLTDILGKELKPWHNEEKPEKDP